MQCEVLALAFLLYYMQFLHGPMYRVQWRLYFEMLKYIYGPIIQLVYVNYQLPCVWNLCEITSSTNWSEIPKFRLKFQAEEYGRVLPQWTRNFRRDFGAAAFRHGATSRVATSPCFLESKSIPSPHVSSQVRVSLGRTLVRVQQVSSPSPSPGVCCSSPNLNPK